MAGTVAAIAFTPCTGAGNDAAQAGQTTPRFISKDSTWFLRLPKDDKVVYRGVVSFDEAGVGNSPIMYPAPNAVGLLAAVLTHGTIVGSMKESQKNKVQEAADKVLLPYQGVLGSYTHQDLMRRGLEKTLTGGSKKLVASSEKPGGDWFIESVPVFSITQDQTAIILDNSVSIYAPNAPSAAAYQNTVRVVSLANDGTDLASFWTANGGEKLKEESAGLLAQSLDIILGEMVGGSKENNPNKTVRYFEGKTEKMERGQLISERCNRVLIKTLRGGLMSVPARHAAAPTGDCNDVPGSLK
jgi:hypothetical protein